MDIYYQLRPVLRLLTKFHEFLQFSMTTYFPQVVQSVGTLLTQHQDPVMLSSYPTGHFWSFLYSLLHEYMTNLIEIKKTT